jgi:gamma-glutamylcyclotransferase (GGCT)/AIG2-like uncharacterized protein YtfP
MNLFVYGTLMFPEIRSAVGGQRLPAPPAILPGYRREGVRGEAYPAIIRDPRGSVTGVLLRGVGRAALRRIDAFEGREYVRRMHRVRLLDEDGRPGRGVIAACYVIAPAVAHRLDGRPWDPEAFAERHLDRYRRRCRRG